MDNFDDIHPDSKDIAAGKNGGGHPDNPLLDKVLNRKRQRRPGSSLDDALHDLAAYQGSEYGSDTIIEPAEAGVAEEKPDPGDSPFSRTGANEDKYVVSGEVGRGGMGVILTAYDSDIRRDVAMKVITGDWQESREFIERFIKEAQVQGQLEHPNICPVHELGVDDSGQVYFTMKMVQGASLADMIIRTKESSGADEPKRLTDVLNIFLKICDGIAFAHSREIIHRDLKPDNIMVGDFGEVYVMDWGLAKILSVEEDKSQDGLFIASPADRSDTMRTMTGSIVGTPAYMPPEQAGGLVEKMDERSDIYSLGALLYELLTLAPPFSAENPWAILSKIGQEKPLSPSRRHPNGNISPELDSIVMKCLEKKKENRYQSVQDLKLEIELFLSGRPIGAMEYSLWRVFFKWVFRNKALALSVLTVLVILMVSFAVSYIRISASEREAVKQRDRADEQRQIAEAQKSFAEKQKSMAEQQRTRAEAERQAADQQRRSAEKNELVGRLNLAMVYEEKKDIGSALDLYSRLKEDMKKKGINVCPFIDLMQWRTVYNEGRSIKSVATASGWGSSFTCVEFAAQANVLAIGSSDLTVQLWNPLTGKLLGSIKGHQVPTTCLAFSLDGRLMATGDSASTIKIWDLKQQREVVSLVDPTLQTGTAHTRAVKCLTFSPDGKKLASGGDEIIKIWDVETGKVINSIWGHMRSIYTLAFSPDGKYLASSGKDGKVKLWDAKDGQLLETLHEHWKVVRKLVFSPDGGILASASDDFSIRLWDMEAKRLLTTLRGHTYDVYSLAFSPDGRILISGSGDNTVRFWDLERLSLISTFREHQSAVNSVSFSSDGRTAATASNDGTVKVWSLAREDMVRTVNLGDLKVRHITFSPDGSKMAIGPWAPKMVPVLFIDPETGGITDRFMKHGSSVRCVTFSPDGKLIATGGDDGVIKLGDVASREEIVALDFEKEEPTTFLSALFSAASEMWNMEARAGWSKDIACVAFSPDGKLLAAGGGKRTVKLWDVATHQVVHTFTECENDVYVLAFSPDGKLLFGGGRGIGLTVWDLENRRFIKQHEKPSSVTRDFSISPDGRLLAVAADGGLIALWDMENMECISVFREHIGRVNSVDFHPDGRVLASAGNDASVKLWDIKTGECLLTLREHESDVESVAFSPDGKLLVSGGRDCTFRIWKFGQALKPFEL